MLTPDQKAGLYITAIIHLAVIIILLLVQIGYSVKKENSFVLDFTQQEEKERQEEQMQLTQDARDKLEQMLAAVASSGTPIRNVTVNRSALKDDRGTDADQLYRDAERLAKELRDGQDSPREDPDDYVETHHPEKQEKEERKVYTGPSVLSWSLEGRKASHLPIPAYRCMGAGEVTVIITVNNQGNVINAKIDESLSSKDGCLQSYAVRAARLSRFSSSNQAPARQMGTITYAFIAQ